jgi:hypothetical protein
VFIAGVLPVHLTGFDAAATDENTVKLDWSMDNETGLALYELQKSRDGVNWLTFNQVTARNQGGTQLYNSQDLSPFTGRSFYRLKITSQANEVILSEVRTIQFGKTNMFTIVINPNPVKESMEIHIRSSKSIQASLRVMDVQGRTIFQASPSLNEGMNDFSFREAARWPAGVYHVVVDTGTDLVTQKFIVVK